jgi:hypothetical protein
VLFTIEIKTVQRVTRGLNELDNTGGGSREIFTVAQKAHRLLKMEIERYLNRGRLRAQTH